MKVIWSSQAMDSLTSVYDYIYERSPQNALTVLDKLLELGESLSS